MSWDNLTYTMEIITFAGNFLEFAIEAMAIEIVDLPIKHVDFAKLFVCLPEDDR